MEVPSIFIFTHDSIGVGEDGPTHQPVEQLCFLGLNFYGGMECELNPTKWHGRTRSGWQFWGQNCLEPQTKLRIGWDIYHKQCGYPLPGRNPSYDFSWVKHAVSKRLLVWAAKLPPPDRGRWSFLHGFVLQPFVLGALWLKVVERRWFNTAKQVGVPPPKKH